MKDPSGRKPEMHDVAVGDHVVLAFEAEPAGIARAGLAAELDVVVIGDGLGADEAVLEIGMDDAGRLRRPGAAGDGPGARLLRTRGEEGDEVEERRSRRGSGGRGRPPSRPMASR